MKRFFLKYFIRHPILMVGIGVLYFLSPFDLLPEGLIGPHGLIDDLLVILFLIYLFKNRKKGAFPRNDNLRASLRDTPPGNQTPYEVLGLPSNAKPDEIKKAYRDLMVQYHPDKVSHLGPDLKELAHQKTRQIQVAYEALTRSNH